MDNYHVDISILPINTQCSVRYYCPHYEVTTPTVPVNKILHCYSNSDIQTVVQYTDTGSRVFKGTVAVSP